VELCWRGDSQANVTACTPSDGVEQGRGLLTSASQESVLGLFTPDEIDEGRSPDAALVTVLAWVREFLAKPHHDLGRKGSVCPFIPGALDHGTIWLAVPAADTEGETGMEEVIHRYRQAFLQLEPTAGDLVMFKTILLVFPAVTEEEAPYLIDKMQHRLKAAFVDDGLMIGQFHARNGEPGLHNPEFRPLRSPVPLLAIRWMVASDLPFLTRAVDPLEMRLRFLRGYLGAANSLMPGPANARMRELAAILAQTLTEVLAAAEDSAHDAEQ
jgi:hypothetical protein